jgi:hypothetical protein
MSEMVWTETVRAAAAAERDRRAWLYRRRIIAAGWAALEGR